MTTAVKSAIAGWAVMSATADEFCGAIGRAQAPTDTAHAYQMWRQLSVAKTIPTTRASGMARTRVRIL